MKQRSTRRVLGVVAIVVAMLFFLYLKTSRRRDGIAPGARQVATDPLEDSYADRFDMLAWLGDADWAENNPDRAANLRERGIPLHHYRSIWAVVLDFSSGEQNGFAMPIPLDDLPLYFLGMKVFKRPGHEPLDEVTWKFRLDAVWASWLTVEDDRGPCNHRVFDVMGYEWQRATAFFQESAKTGLTTAGLDAIADLEYEGGSDRFQHSQETYTATRSTKFYDITVDAKTSQSFDDRDKPDGYYCVAHLRLQLRPK